MLACVPVCKVILQFYSLVAPLSLRLLSWVSKSNSESVTFSMNK